MLKGLFINNKKAKDSIHESGYMAYQCLKLSSKYELDYIEVDQVDREIKTGYDFYFFNYHPITMRWLATDQLRKKLKNVITMILEVAPGDAFVLCPPNDFDIYCALDPTIVSKDNLYAFPRPLEQTDFKIPAVKNEIPVIGSFGFATTGKGFEHVVEAVNNEFEKAIIRFNIPYGDFVPDSKEYSEKLALLCKELAKPGIEVQITHDFMSKENLIKWCASNDLNCFLYDRHMPGLAATTDQAIVSGKPLAVSANDTFRHITAYLPPYPKFSLQDSLVKSPGILLKVREEWCPQKFALKFEEVLDENNIVKGKSKEGRLLLPLINLQPKKTLKSRFKKIKSKIRKLLGA